MSLALSQMGAVVPNDADAGRNLAQTACAECHAIGRVGPSPLKQAPPFRQVMKHRRAEDLAEELADGMFVGHPAMPKYQLKASEISDLVSYLRRLQTPAP
jgi:mono/diheme cytochrome c family protein